MKRATSVTLRAMVAHAGFDMSAIQELQRVMNRREYVKCRSCIHVGESYETDDEWCCDAPIPHYLITPNLDTTISPDVEIRCQCYKPGHGGSCGV